ncbi:MAG: hypothetical protein AAF755_03130 [Pseudomonadota bacterium]
MKTRYGPAAIAESDIVKAWMVLLGVALAGCNATGEYVSSYEPRPGLILHSNSDDLQNTLIKDRGVQTQVCLEPSPDVGSGGGTSLAVSDRLGETADISQTRDVVPLGGRTEVTLVARELMYRACELAANQNLTPEQTLKVYQMFLQSLSQVAAHVSTPQQTTTYYGSGTDPINQ